MNIVMNMYGSDLNTCSTDCLDNSFVEGVFSTSLAQYKIIFYTAWLLSDVTNAQPAAATHVYDALIGQIDVAVADDTYTNGGDTMMMTWYSGGTGTDVQGSYCATADCSDGAIDTVDTDDFTAIADAVPGNYGMCKEVWSVKDVDLDTWNLICTKVEV